jgi:hypothetical protein
MTVRRWRIGLLLLGLALLGLGGLVLLQEVNPKRYVGILTWFVGAIIIHDAIIAPTVFFTSLVLRRVRMPAVVVAIIQAALVIGGIILLLVVPEVIKKAIGTLSSSILPQNYALHLVVFLVVLGLLTAGAIALYARVFANRQKLRSPSDQA